MSVVDTQIEFYKALRNSKPTLSEDEILNKLILSRIASPPAIVSAEEDLAHYQELLVKPSKDLEEVILKIIHYEFIETRMAKIQNIPIDYVIRFQCDVGEYIQRQIRDMFQGGQHDERR